MFCCATVCHWVSGVAEFVAGQRCAYTDFMHVSVTKQHNTQRPNSFVVRHLKNATQELAFDPIRVFGARLLY